VDIYRRVLDTLTGNKPNRIPFIDRLELWYNGHRRRGTLPEAYRHLSLTEIHRAVGMGQQKFVPICDTKLHGVELILSRDGVTFYHEQDPVVDFFPRLYSAVPYDTPGVTIAEIVTPCGILTTRQELLPNMVEAGMGPYMSEHPIKAPDDYPALRYIIEHIEFILRADRLQAEQDQIGDIGFVVPQLNRIPFQQVLLDFVGEMSFFYILHDEPDFAQRMIALLDEKLIDFLVNLAALDVPYVEFLDNLEAQMTNPRLFAEFCLPAYQRYTAILHDQDKKVGSHTDGNIKPLLGLLAETGLDVCESFSPAPLTACTFDEAWTAWQARRGPIIWGGIPSLILEPETSDAEFEAYINHVLDTVAGQPIILGVGDMVVPVNLIERVHYIATRVEAQPVALDN
jgi:hypothetical protein